MGLSPYNISFPLNLKHPQIIRSESFQFQFWVPEAPPSDLTSPHIYDEIVESAARSLWRNKAFRTIDRHQNNIQQLHDLLSSRAEDAVARLLVDNPLRHMISSTLADFHSKFDGYRVELARLDMFFERLLCWPGVWDNPRRIPMARIAEQCIWLDVGVAAPRPFYPW